MKRNDKKNTSLHDLKRILCVFLVFMMGCGKQEESIDGSKEKENDGLWQYTKISEQEPIQTALTNPTAISFWISPSSNYPGTTLLKIGTEDQFLQLTGSGLNDGVLSGITLHNHQFKRDQWVVAEGKDTLQTGRWNYVVLNISEEETSIFLNGERVAYTQEKYQWDIPEETLLIGSDGKGSTYLDGKYTDLVISNRLTTLEEVQEAYRLKKPAVLLDTIHFADADCLRRDLWFDQFEVEGIPVTWSVEENPIMNALGVRKDATRGGTVHAKARIDIEDVSAEKEFTFVLPEWNDTNLLSFAKDALSIELGAYQFSNAMLPQNYETCSYSYEVVKGEAIIEEGRLLKTGENEMEPITLEATISSNEKQEKETYDLLLLDPIYGYAMSYFNEENEKEVGHIAISEDGFHWDKVEMEPIETDLGSGRLRDPNVVRSKEGTFLLSATEADTPYIYLATSNDLIHFENFKEVLVSVKDDGIGLTGEKAWAPEVTYDVTKDLYYIYYSDPSETKGAMYYITTRDFQAFSYPKVFFDPGYPVIDGTVFSMQGKYWMLYKDERKGSQTIYPAFANHLEEGFPNTLDWQYLSKYRAIEGPMVCKKKEGDGYLVYFDHFANHTFMAGTFTDLSYDGGIEWIAQDAYQLPEEDVRHGSIVPITQKEYKTLADKQ